MATEEQAKKKIVVALYALRVILTQGPTQHYPGGLDQHPKVKKLVNEILTALAPHSATLDPRPPYFRDFLTCDVLLHEELPAYWEILNDLDHYIKRFGGKPVGGTGKADWCFDSEPPEDSKFKHGPLETTLKLVAKALSTDERTLKNHNGQSACWIQRVHKRLFRFWFSSQQNYAKVNGEYLSARSETARNST